MNTKTEVKITITNDYDGTFENRVKSAIKLNEEKDIEMYPNITIDSGPYRSHCMFYKEIDKDTMSLDFYSASRVFGFEHTIEDIANAIAIKH